jgi:hypothetical protein
MARIRRVEASMAGPFDKSCEIGSRVHRRRDVRLFGFSALVLIVLIGLVACRPAAAPWISEAAQAVINFVPGLAPTRLAQPAGKTRPAKACRLIRA